jgi:hypothetical protein
MASPEDRPSEEQRLKELHELEEVLLARALELQHLLFMVRCTQTAERLILLISGAITGILAFKLFLGLQ